MFSYLLIFKKNYLKNSLNNIYPYFFTGFFIYYLPTTLRYWSLQYVSAAKVSFFFNFEPFVAAFFSYLIFKSKLTTRQWFSMILGLIGMLIFLTSSNKIENLMGGLSFISWPEISLIIGILSSGFGLVMLKHSMHKYPIKPLVMNAYSTLISSILAFITALAFEKHWLKTYSPEIIFPTLPLVLYMALASNVFNRTLYAHLVKKYSATFMAYSAFLGPIITAIIGWFVLNEKITWQFYISGTIIFLGIYIFIKDERY